MRSGLKTLGAGIFLALPSTASAGHLGAYLYTVHDIDWGRYELWIPLILIVESALIHRFLLDGGPPRLSAKLLGGLLGALLGLSVIGFLLEGVLLWLVALPVLLAACAAVGLYLAVEELFLLARHGGLWKTSLATAAAVNVLSILVGLVCLAPFTAARIVLYGAPALLLGMIVIEGAALPFALRFAARRFGGPPAESPSAFRRAAQVAACAVLMNLVSCAAPLLFTKSWRSLRQESVVSQTDMKGARSGVVLLRDLLLF